MLTHLLSVELGLGTELLVRISLSLSLVGACGIVRYNFRHVYWNEWVFVLHSTGYLPNSCLAVEAMLATASIGAIWSSTSPDFGSTVSYCSTINV